MFARLAILFLMVVAGACSQKSTAEKLVGTWERDIGRLGTDVMTFRSDGTCESLTTSVPRTSGTSLEIVTKSRWKIDGEKLLVTDETAVQINKKDGVITRQKEYGPRDWTSTIEWQSEDSFSLHDEKSSDFVTYKRVSR